MLTSLYYVVIQQGNRLASCHPYCQRVRPEMKILQPRLKDDATMSRGEKDSHDMGDQSRFFGENDKIILQTIKDEHLMEFSLRWAKENSGNASGNTFEDSR